MTKGSLLGVFGNGKVGHVSNLLGGMGTFTGKEYLALLSCKHGFMCVNLSAALHGYPTCFITENNVNWLPYSPYFLNWCYSSVPTISKVV